MKPSEAELKRALAEADRLRAKGEDSHFMAKSLLYMNQRNEALEKIVKHAERFLRFGLPEEEHAQLRRLLDSLREERRREADEEAEHFGL